MAYNIFDEKSFGRGIKHDNMSDRQWSEESHKSIIRNFKKIKVHSPFIDNICGTDLANMRLINKFYYVLLISLVDTRGLFLWKEIGVSISNAFQKLLKNLIANQTKYG